MISATKLGRIDRNMLQPHSERGAIRPPGFGRAFCVSRQESMLNALLATRARERREKGSEIYHGAGEDVSKETMQLCFRFVGSFLCNDLSSLALGVEWDQDSMA